MVKRIKNAIVDGAISMLRAVLANENARTAFTHALQDPRISFALYRAVAARPSGLDYHWANHPNSIDEERFKLATREAAEYVTRRMAYAKARRDPFELIEHACTSVKVDGLFLEFGVFSGTTINHIASRVGVTVHGFDSFQGLPEQWGGVSQGTFSTRGHLPEVRENVRLHVGWFNETLPTFLREHEGPVAFLHVDSDLYSSAKTILDLLDERLVSGSIIVFDEYFNYPEWKDHEYKAFQEYIARTGRKYRYLGYAGRGYSVSVQIE